MSTFINHNPNLDISPEDLLKLKALLAERDKQQPPTIATAPPTIWQKIAALFKR